MSGSSAEQQLGQELPLAAGEAGCGLVEHQELRLGRERHRDRDLPVLAVREVADELGKLVVDRRPLGGRARPFAERLVTPRQRHRAQVAGADAERREVDAVLDADAEEHAGLLVGARQPALGPLPGRHRRHVLAEELDGAGRRGQVARDDVEEGGLAGPVRAEDGPTLAVSDIEIDVTHGEQPAEAPADSPQAESRRGDRDGGRSLGHAYLMTLFVMTPFVISRILPCHGSFFFTHCGLRAAGRRARRLEQPAERLIDVRHEADELGPDRAVGVLDDLQGVLVLDRLPAASRA